MYVCIYIYKSLGPPRRRTCLNLLISVGINLRSFVCLLQITCESCPAAECTTGLFTWMKIVTHYTSVPCKFHLSFSHALLLFFTPQTPLTGHFFQVAGVYNMCVYVYMMENVYKTQHRSDMYFLPHEMPLNRSRILNNT